MRLRELSPCAVLFAATIAIGCDRPDTTPLAPRPALSADAVSGARSHGIKRVLLISVDGLHALDLHRYVATHHASTLASLSARGATFLNASTSRPSDSWPGLLAIVTGGSPRSTGVIYEDSYDRSLSPPGSNCATVGTEVLYSEFVDVDQTRLDGGGGIDPAKLPRDPRAGCTPVYPHSYLRVNTVFEVIKAAGLRTAWSDKSLGYEVVNGPSGHGVDDLFNPEIAAPLPNGDAPNHNVTDIEMYDSIKVQAILNEIDGWDHAHARHVGVPAIFGMNFQAVSVGQKTAGYVDAAGTPTADLQRALDFVDASLGRFVSELKRQELFETTLIIISAKHGQTPINPAERRIVSNKLVPGIVNGIESGLLAQGTLDDLAVLWLTDHAKTGAVVSALDADRGPLGITSILSGDRLADAFNDPRTDPRAPDAIVVVREGVIYASPTASKLSEHGGFGRLDTNVPILVSGPGIHGDDEPNESPVTTAQIAPTILQELGLDPEALQAVRIEGTRALPLDHHRDEFHRFSR
jgi:type I phosphodiesterase/nucleotide pyrophosphatase